ncbi:MAG: rhodanese-like domain-containing protein [Bacteroidota bacterium]
MMNRFIFIMFLFPLVLYSQNVKTVGSLDAKVIIDSLNMQESVIIDGRDSTMFYEMGHIKGAIYIDTFRTDLQPALFEFIEKKTIVVYCTMKRRSLMIIDSLKSMEYKGEIVLIEDGISGWIENNLPVTNQ